MPPGRAGRLVLATTVGHDSVDSRLAALTPLRHTLGLCAIALFDDGTLEGADRVRLARACSDPLILAPTARRAPGFPTDAEWVLLLSALEQRRNAYWVTVRGAVPDEAATALSQAIASNRSFAILGKQDMPGAVEAHLEALAESGFPYIGTSPRLVGFAACGDGLALASTVLARLETALGERAREPDMAHVVAGFVLAREREPVLIRDGDGPVNSPGRISML